MGAPEPDQDDVNDPYYPFGKPDQLEVALMMAHVAQLTRPDELEQVFDMVTVNAARAARLDDYGIAPGRRADLVVIDAPSVHEALRTQPPRRHVIVDGREVARATLLRELRRPEAPVANRLRSATQDPRSLAMVPSAQNGDRSAGMSLTGFSRAPTLPLDAERKCPPAPVPGRATV